MMFPISDELYCVTRCRLETSTGLVFAKGTSSFGVALVGESRRQLATGQAAGQ
jgi:hypothetical protein